MSAIKNKHISLTTRAKLFDEVTKLLTANPSKKYYLNVTERPKKRSLSANAVYQTWLPAISDSLAMTLPEATRYTKLTFGLPILFANKDFGTVIYSGLENKGFFAISYERQLAYMEHLPVTRLFTTEMHNKLRDDLQHFFGAQGVALEYEK